MDILLSSVSQGLLWSIMAIGVYITFRLIIAKKRVAS